MGLKARLAAWAIGKGVSEFLKHRTTLDQPTRKRIVEAIKMTLKPKSPKQEPVIYGAVASVLVAVCAHYGLQLDPDALITTVSTVVVVITFIVRRFVTPVKP